MLGSVLIANRGEIACRIIKTARRLGLRTIAVYSEADARSFFVRLADEAHLIGPAPAQQSYLRIDTIIDVARRTGAECIHPGYGFLSERAEFAEACAANGIVFVGPPPAAIRAMGLKDAAKALVQKAGVPVVPGYHGMRQEPDFLRQKAYEIGYPVLIKAVAGGGGKGMKRVDRVAEFEAALASAQREATGAFGDPRVLVEKYILAPRHIEIQVFADSHGHIVHLFERDCSLQRRHQKVIEEAPAPGMTEEMRRAMGAAAVEAARAVGYVGAGTVEFIVDAREGLRPDRFYFMEMNTRLQVEHPVTEAITSLDLVELQLRVASGEALPFSQDDLRIDGHAVEARVYAEDPEREFLPSTGKLWALRLPSGEGIRVDTGVEAGGEVTPFYDPMIAKIIARGSDRGEALQRLARALGDTIVAGPKSNVGFLKRLCQEEEFARGVFDTGYIDQNLAKLGAVPQPPSPNAIRTGALHLLKRNMEKLRSSLPSDAARDPWNANDAFQLVGQRHFSLPVVTDGEAATLIVEWHDEQPLVQGSNATDPDRNQVIPADGAVLVLDQGRQTRVALYDPFDVDLEHLDEGGTVRAPMHGKLVAQFVSVGDRVAKGQRLAIMEAMKMEHALVAPVAGDIVEVSAVAGAQVEEGARLFTIQAEGEPA
ncbi:acetyl/propionyl/methylcrotonyl-CoA carboxylase subunit alpha [Microvirga massiliensis]|uniref:acetyl/propionyl/methylcrotonyl-CoA carboxylase subunit alpha n=1 Tax=Microvirga massiliensis TaxID=1033741 RepID=UPI00062BB1A0|nr:acetyl-CoA carboxylase biotin carboxylase subunit [Microvirga massiliensis]